MLALLEERATRLDVERAQGHAAREVAEKRVPRLLWIESEFHSVRDAELAYVGRLAHEIATGVLEGLEWWRHLHVRDGPVDAPPMNDYMTADSQTRDAELWT